MSASPSDMPSQFEAPHPEFGYLAPTKRLRRKIVLTLKATVLGGLAGAAAMYFVTIGREDKPLTMLAKPVLIEPASPTPTAPAPPPVATTPVAPARTPAVAAPASSAPTPAKPSRVASGATAPAVRFLPETIALPEASPRVLGLRGSTPAIAPTASGLAPQAPATHGASLAASTSATAGVPAAVAKAVAKPKKKVVRARPPEPDPEPRTAFARAPRPFGPPIFGFGW